jgi:microcystin degradation protein MlrC
MFMHETNTFAPGRTGPAQYAEQFRGRGETLRRRREGTRSSVGGFIDQAREDGVELVFSAGADACPGGPVTREVFETVRDEVLGDLREHGPFDGLLLALHGAMVTEDSPDGEGEFLRAMRAAVGPRVPVAVTLDLHANVTPLMAEQADILIAYKTYPHVDAYERAREATSLLARTARGEIHPRMALIHPPFAPPIRAQYTEEPAGRVVMDMARVAEQSPRIHSVSVCFGFPLADVPEMGFSVVAIAEKDVWLAHRTAREIADYAFDHREAYRFQHRGVADGVAAALACPDGPVLVAETSDNPGGGTPGDSVQTLAELLRAGARDFIVSTVCDPGVAAQAHAAGAGAAITCRLGGKVDGFHGPSLDVTATVVSVSDGAYVCEGPMMRGTCGDLGPTAVLAIGGGHVIVNSYNQQTYDPQVIRSQGLEPARARVVVVKSALHYKAAFLPLVRHVVEISGEGLSRADFWTLPFTRVRRPLYPLDPI